MTESGWWRRNRRGLAALPVVVLAALAASSYRVEDRWWLDEPHDFVDADQGEWVDFADTQYDRTGDVPFEVRVRLDGVRPADGPFGDGNMSVPPGSRAVAIELELAADSDTPLAGCELTITDTAGTSYAYLTSSPSIRQASSPCVPPDARGPDLDLVEGLQPDDGPPRPDQWSVSPAVIVPEDAELSEVVLTWGPPRAVRMRITEAP